MNKKKINLKLKLKPKWLRNEIYVFFLYKNIFANKNYLNIFFLECSVCGG